MKYSLLRFKEPRRDTSRKILHVDMDSFYASVEIRDNPRLRGLPVIIARHPKESGGRGVVATASYEARKYGVHSAMSAKEAYERCPQGVFVPADFEKYRQVSAQIRAIFKRYTDVIQPLSLDEAYLDVTENKVDQPSATLIARDIQRTIYDELHLTSSVGVSYNKFLAKIASDVKKPAGLTVLTPEEATDFLMELPIEAFIGVGEKTLDKMHETEIFTGADLIQYSEVELAVNFGKFGRTLYKRVRGIDNRPVEAERVRKSLGKEETYFEELYTDNQVTTQLKWLSEEVFDSLSAHGMHGKTIVLKVRYHDFETYTKRKTLNKYISRFSELYAHVLNLWREVGDAERGIRLLGVTLTTLDPFYYEELPLDLFSERKESARDDETSEDSKLH